MFKITKQVLLLVLTLLFISNAHAEIIRPGTGINEITTAIEAANAGDVILLARGEWYFTQEIIDVNVPLSIMADDATTGFPPVISALVKEDGTVAQSIMEIRADVVIKNIYFSGGTSGRAGGKDSDRAITFLDTEGMRAEFDGVWFTDFDRRTVQLEAEAMKFYATNCIWTDDEKIEGPSEGRAIDLRQYGPDTLVVQNCSFVNVGNRWIRHVTSSGKPIGYALIDHNTFVNGINYHPAFDLGQIEKLIFTNNILQDPGILGSDFVIRPSQNDGKFEIGLPENYYNSDKSLAAHRTREVYYDREEGITVFGAHGVDTVGTEITMHNNYFHMDQSIINKLAENDTLSVQAWMCSQFERSIVGSVENAFTISDIAFTDVPAPGLQVVDEYVGYWDQNPYTLSNHTAPDSIDLTYSTSDPAYTAAEGGFPLGDLNWFPEKKAEWENYVPSEGPTIIWVADGGTSDQAWVDLLIAEGYDVQREDVTMQGSSLTDDQIARLNTADLIIISRSTNSGDYKAPEWHSIEVPIMVCNGQVVRSSRWQFFGSTSTNELEPPRAEVLADHTIFDGITLEANDSLDIYDPAVAVVIFSADATQNNGTVLAKSGSSLMIVEWNNTAEVYNDATTAIPAASRMFFGTSGEMNLTADGVKVYLNAVEYLISGVADPTSVDFSEQGLPTKFGLNQNYPNPFNPTTNINFSVEKPGTYALSVYNLTGQKIATLINGQLAVGYHNITFDASNLSSGIYFYTLTGANVSVTKKMVLMK